DGGRAARRQGRADCRPPPLRQSLPGSPADVQRRLEDGNLHGGGPVRALPGAPRAALVALGRFRPGESPADGGDGLAPLLGGSTLARVAALRLLRDARARSGHRPRPDRRDVLRLLSGSPRLNPPAAEQARSRPTGEVTAHRGRGHGPPRTRTTSSSP